MRIVFVSLLLIAFGARAADVGPTFGGRFAFTETGGEAIYRSVCAGCHMPDGRGAIGAGSYPSLMNDGRLAASSYPLAVVLHGRRAMPPFGRMLTDQQVADVVTFIRRHFGNSYAEPVVATEVAAAR